MKKTPFVSACGSLAVCVVALPSLAQDYSVLRINEVIADNRTTEPRDVTGNPADMVEIYNTGDELLFLGRGFDAAGSLALSNTVELPLGTADDPLWTFADGLDSGETRVVLDGDSTIVFCDSSLCERSCEPHASFRIDDDGVDVISLWGPEESPGVRPLIDQVYLPPLRTDVSFGRKADVDGAPLGPAPVPLEETFDHFIFFPPGTTTFGTCIELAVPGCICSNPVGLVELPRRLCTRRSRNSSSSFPPSLSLRRRTTTSSNSIRTRRASGGTNDRPSVVLLPSGTINAKSPGGASASIVPISVEMLIAKPTSRLLRIKPGCSVLD